MTGWIWTYLVLGRASCLIEWTQWSTKCLSEQSNTKLYHQDSCASDSDDEAWHEQEMGNVMLNVSAFDQEYSRGHKD